MGARLWGVVWVGCLGQRGLLTMGANAKVEGVIRETGCPHKILKVATPWVLGGYAECLQQRHWFVACPSVGLRGRGGLVVVGSA